VVITANELILKQMQNIELSDLEEEQIVALQQNIISNVNLNKMREQVESACRNLSQVTQPRIGADLKYIALDNQERLELIFKLLDSYNRFERDVRSFRRNKYNCNSNYEHIYNFLLITQDMINAVLKHSDFKIKEWEENNRQVQEIKRLEEKNLYIEGN
jgi:hypothetical protein